MLLPRSFSSLIHTSLSVRRCEEAEEKSSHPSLLRGSPFPAKKHARLPLSRKKAGPFLSAKTFNHIPQARFSFTSRCRHSSRPSQAGTCGDILYSRAPFTGTLSLHLTRGFSRDIHRPQKSSLVADCILQTSAKASPKRFEKNQLQKKPSPKRPNISPLAARSSDQSSTCPCQQKSLWAYFSDRLAARRRFCCIILCLVVFVICF